MSNSNKNDKLKKAIRESIIDASYKSGACHISSALSCVDIILEIHSKMKTQDIFIFGKASGVLAYYSYLAEIGKLNKKDLPKLIRKYPLPSKEVGLIHSFGSLGHALPFAVGFAYANRKRNVYVLLSDGEISEGTTWESALWARQHKLKNLYVYVDYNKLQACGSIKKILDLETAFDFLGKTLKNFRLRYTIKGEGIPFMKSYEWHYKNLTPELYIEAKKWI